MESKDRKHELFRNIVLKPKEGDKRTFEEYEKEMSYELFESSEGLVDNLVKGREYVVYGCNTDDGELAVLIYGFPNNLNIPYVNGKSIADRVKMHGHKGFQIECAKSDERLFNSGETYDVWIDPFTRRIESFWNGARYNKDGSLEQNKYGVTRLNYTYDYVWLVLQKGDIMPFREISETWEKISDDKYDYYLVWINQEDRQ